MIPGVQIASLILRRAWQQVPVPPLAPPAAAHEQQQQQQQQQQPYLTMAQPKMSMSPSAVTLGSSSSSSSSDAEDGGRERDGDGDGDTTISESEGGAQSARAASISLEESVSEKTPIQTTTTIISLDIEKGSSSDHGGGEDSGGTRPQLIELPYSLRIRKLKIAVIVFMVSLDGFLLPTFLFYVLKYAAHVSDARNITITTCAFGFLTLFQYIMRLYRLLQPNSPYLPLATPHRWYLDLYQLQFTLGFILITVLLSFASVDSQGNVLVRNVSLAPCLLLLQCGPQFLVSCLAYRLGWVNRVRVSSSLAGERCVPAVFTVVEDVIGVDGKGGGRGGFRERWKGRYLQSGRFREMLYWQTVFWGMGATVGGGVTLAVVLAPGVDQYVAYGFGWVFPFIWSGVMVAITIKWVQRDLRAEREEWETADVGVIRGYQL